MSMYRVSVKPGLWTGLDYGLDWTGLTKTDSEHHQGYNSLSPALSQVASYPVEASSPRFLRGQRSLSYLISKNELQLCDRGIFLLFSTLQ